MFAVSIQVNVNFKTIFKEINKFMNYLFIKDQVLDFLLKIKPNCKKLFKGFCVLEIQIIHLFVVFEHYFFQINISHTF